MSDFILIFICILVGVILGITFKAITTKNKTKYLLINNKFFEEFFKRQLKIQKILGHDFEKMTINEQEFYTKDSCLYLLEEVHELLRETNFKSHKKVKHPVNIENIKEEIADILHFVVNLTLVWKITANDLAEACFRKNDKNLKRIQSSSY